MLLFSLAMSPSLAGPPTPQNPTEKYSSQTASTATDESEAVNSKPAESSDASPAAGTQPATGSNSGAADTKVAILKVVVTGNGKPVRKAGVKMVVRPQDEQLPERYTDARGEVTLSSSTLGRAKVRIIAPQWQSVLREITLVAGSQTLLVRLQPLP